ncbi:hypothetical protein ID0408_00530 [Helicobacter pylori]
MSALKVKENECVKIMTGAMVPKGIETIIPIECMLESHGFKMQDLGKKLKSFSASLPEMM